MGTIFGIFTNNTSSAGKAQIQSDQRIVVFDGLNLKSPNASGIFSILPLAEASASYVVVGATSSLANERVLTAGPGITINDGGSNGNVTVSASLLAGTNITINKVGNSYAISASVSGSGGTSGSIEVPQFFFHPIQFALSAASPSPTSVAGEYTVGCTFYLTDTRTITGVRIYTDFIGIFTGTLWDSDGVILAEKISDISTTGFNNILFDTPVEVTATYKAISVSQYNSASYNYGYLGDLNNPYGLPGGPSLLWRPGIGYYNSGYNQPLVAGGGVFYMTEPIFATVTQSLV